MVAKVTIVTIGTVVTVVLIHFLDVWLVESGRLLAS